MPPAVELRAVQDSDVESFFDHQLDPDANRMAAFTSRDPGDHPAFLEHWSRIRVDPTVTTRTVLVDGRVAGYVASFLRFGKPEVSYRLAKEFWGRGVATRALAALLPELAARPLYARAAKDNIASRRVLEKCGFVICAEDRGFANARGEEIGEFIFELAVAAETTPG